MSAPGEHEEATTDTDMFTSLKRRAALRRTSRDLYGSIVTQARQPAFYRQWDVPDTMEGRLEMIILHVALALDRLGLEEKAGLELGRAVAEAYIADVDDALRQIGTGDMGVPRRVKRAAAALRERRFAYSKALGVGDRKAIGDVVVGFLYGDGRASPPPADAAAGFADYMIAARQALGAIPSDALLAGTIAFPAPDAFVNRRQPTRDD